MQTGAKTIHLSIYRAIVIAITVFQNANENKSARTLGET